MFARSHKSLMLIHHYKSLAKGGIAGSRYPTCLVPFRTWDQRPFRMMSAEPKPPSPEAAPSSDTSKLFVISSSKSAPNLTGEGSSVVNHLPPKPRLDRANGDQQFKVPTWFKDQNWQQLANQGKDRLVAMVGTIFTRETLDHIRNGLMTAWEMSVRTANSIVYWCRVFLDSREYFYLRYYTLLVLENSVHYVRLGFVALMRRVRTTVPKE
uniref:Uncharacterized protein n=1 Tax=Culex tarsalis TaxID=7177 RepID=A0A1Q3FUG6_CULTA